MPTPSCPAGLSCWDTNNNNAYDAQDIPAIHFRQLTGLLETSESRQVVVHLTARNE